MTSRQRRGLLNNRPRVYRHARGRLEETGSCTGVSKKRNAGYGASHVCSLAVGAALQNRNLAGTAEAKRARCVASAVPERQKGVMSGETVRRTPDGACVDRTNRAFTCLTRSMLEDLWIMGAPDPDMPMDIAIDQAVRDQVRPGSGRAPGPGYHRRQKARLKGDVHRRTVYRGRTRVRPGLPPRSASPTTTPQGEGAARDLPGVRRQAGHGDAGPRVPLHRGDVRPDGAAVAYLIPCVNRGHVPEAVHEFVEGWARARLRSGDNKGLQHVLHVHRDNHGQDKAPEQEKGPHTGGKADRLCHQRS